MELFDLASAELERRTDFSVLESRGTMRIALKAAGLEVRSLTREQLLVVLDRVLPGELELRGVENAAALCGEIVAVIPMEAAGTTSPVDSPDAIFERMGRRGI